MATIIVDGEVIDLTTGVSGKNLVVDGQPVSATNPLPVTGGGGGGGGDASAANQTTMIAQIGDSTLADTPNAVSLLGRLKTLVSRFPAALTASGNLKVAVLEGGTAGGSTEAKQDALITLVGEVQATPTANTLLSRLKAIADKLPTLGTQAIAASQSVTPATSATWTVTGPLTDTQLRATAVPVSGTITANLGTIAGVALESTQSAQSTLIGAVTETAPASDTASSGLNGRLQRIAQRLSTLITTAGTLALDSTLTTLSGKLPATLGQKTMANSLAVALASDQAALPVSAVVGQTYFEGIATITRPADTTTYAAGDAVYSSTTGAAASTVVLNVANSGTPVPAGSTVVITSVRVTSGNTGTAVLPTMDVFLKPVTFTAIGDNLAFAPAAGVTEGMAVAPVDFAKALGTGGMVAWNDGLTVRLKLDAGSSTLHFQPQVRLAYVPVSAEALRFVFSGFIQA